MKFNVVIYGFFFNYIFNYSIMILEICFEVKIGKINIKEYKDGKMVLGVCCKIKREYNVKIRNLRSN